MILRSGEIGGVHSEESEGDGEAEEIIPQVGGWEEVHSRVNIFALPYHPSEGDLVMYEEGGVEEKVVVFCGEEIGCSSLRTHDWIV